MLTSVNRYSFQPQHFRLAHDVTLDNAGSVDDGNGDLTFEHNKENDFSRRLLMTPYTVPRHADHSLSDHKSNHAVSARTMASNLLEARNQRNAAKSRLDNDVAACPGTPRSIGGGGPTAGDESGSFDADDVEPAKKHKPDSLAFVGRTPRIEDLAFGGGQGVGGVPGGRSADAGVGCGLNAFTGRQQRKKDPGVMCRIGSEQSPVAQCKVKDQQMGKVGLQGQNLQAAPGPLANTGRTTDAAVVTCVKPVQHVQPRRQDHVLHEYNKPDTSSFKLSAHKSSLSLAEELQAAVLSESGSADASAIDPALLPLGVLFDGRFKAASSGGIAQFLIDVAELGSPDQVDPINKYRDVVCDLAYGSVVEDASVSGGCDPCRSASVSSSSSSTSPGSSADDEDAMARRLGGGGGGGGGAVRGGRCGPVESGVRDPGSGSSRATDSRRRSDDVGPAAVPVSPRTVSTGCCSGADDDGAKKHLLLGHRDRTSPPLESSRGPSSPARRSLLSPPVPGVPGSGTVPTTRALTSSGSPALRLRPASAPVAPPIPRLPMSGSLALPGVPGSGSLEYDLDEVDATHRGCHRFVPRHPGELSIEIGDPIYVELEEDDLWCEGINLRTKQRGIFPTAYATDLSILEDVPRSRKFFLKFLGSVEVSYHRGNDVLCQAINKIVVARKSTLQTSPPPLVCLEINEIGIKMTERTKNKKSILTDESSLAKKLARLLSKGKEPVSEIDHLFSLKNICFCGYHPKNDRYLGIISKHPLAMRFACHVFQSEKSTRTVAEAIGDSFQKFYEEYLAAMHPTEDFYLE